LIIALALAGNVIGWPPSNSSDISAQTTISQAAETVTVTIGTNPGGLPFTVDGVNYTTAVPFTWTVGSTHTISAASQQGTGDTRFVWDSWSDGGTQTHDIVAAMQAAYTANFTKQYILNVWGGGGSTNPPSGYFNDGQQVQITATNVGHCQFIEWQGYGSGSYTGYANPAAVTMYEPINEIAGFECGPPTATATATATWAPTATPTATPMTFVVNTTEDTQDAVPGDRQCMDSLGRCSLRAAITEGNAGFRTIVTLPMGIYTQLLTGPEEDANASGDWDITSKITIDGAGSATTIIQASAMSDAAAERVLHCLNGAEVYINGVTIRNGKHRFVSANDLGGGGILVQGSATGLTLNSVIVSDNVSDGSGGGIRVSNLCAHVDIANSSIVNNRAGSDIPGSTASGGGLDLKGESITVYPEISITNSVISGNTAQTSVTNARGGGLAESGGPHWYPRLTNSTITNNRAISTANSPAAGYGGGIYESGDGFDCEYCNIAGNIASGFGGGVYQTSLDGESSIRVAYSSISDNTAPIAGGIMNFSEGGLGGFNVAWLYFESSTVSGNTASDPSAGVGGGIYNFRASTGTGAELTLGLSTVSSNHAARGAGVYNGPTANFRVQFSTIAANVASTQGGGIWHEGTANTLLLQSLIADNESPIGPDILGAATSQGYNHIENISGTVFTPAAHDVTGVDAMLGPLADNGGPTLTHLPGSNSPVHNTIPQGPYACDTYLRDQRGIQRLVGTGCEKGSVEIQGEPPTPTNTATSTATSTATFTPVNTSTSTASATPTPTVTPIPGCSPAVNIINDGGFEIGGLESAIWDYPQFATSYGTPLCRTSFCSGSLPRSGALWAVFGRDTLPATARLGQNVFIPSGLADLHFWMRIARVSAPFTDVLRVKVDGTNANTYTEPTIAESVYTERAINLNAWANNAVHNITFDYVGLTNGEADFAVDDVSLFSVPGCVGPTPTSTNTPTNTATLTPTATSTPAPTHTEPPPTPSVHFSAAAYAEDESQTAVITISRNFSNMPDSVSFSTANGTASGGTSCSLFGADYITVTNQLVVFNPGEAAKTVNVTLCGDGLPGERDETVNLSLTGSTVGPPAAAVLTINDTATQFENQTNIAINADGAADVYPSTMTVAYVPFIMFSMRVTVYDYVTAVPANVSFLLVGPGGQKFILMANAGGLSSSGPATLTFLDTAGQIVPFNGPLATGDFEPTSFNSVADFPAPAPAGPYNLPGSTIGGTGAQMMGGSPGGTFIGTDPNGTWKLYVREQAPPPPFAPSTVVGNISGWGIEFIGATSATAFISGRVTTADGQGIRNARVVVTGNSLANPRVVSTGSFGYFTFEGLASDETYVVTVDSKRYTFSTPSRVITLVDNVVDADFVAEPQE
jgi:CSLREA domain-containing protein